MYASVWEDSRTNNNQNMFSNIAIFLAFFVVIKAAVPKDAPNEKYECIEKPIHLKVVELGDNE
jgi:hypothetical protein